MKHLTALLCALILILSIPITAHAENDVYTEGTLYYTIGNESVTIVGCFGRKTEVTVPASIAGYPVNSIASGAFTTNSFLKKLNLPDTITTIQEGAIKENIQVIYNANTKHPQETPPDIITGREPVLVPADSDSNQNSKSANKQPASSSNSPANVHNHGEGDLVMEGDVDYDSEEAKESAAKTNSSKTASNSSSSANTQETTVSATDENGSTVAPGTTSEQSSDTALSAASDKPESSNNIWIIIIIIVVAVIAVGVVVFVIIRKKKKAMK